MGKVTIFGGAKSPSAPMVFDPVLENNTWEQIRAASDMGIASTLWKVGDTKTITIEGPIGASTFPVTSIDVVIIGFDHNAALEGSNRIHFQLGKINGTDVCLIDGQYANTPGTSGLFSMNTGRTNSGGWASSHMRKTVLGSDSDPMNPTSSTLLSALPADLRAVMKAMTKYSDNTGGGTNTASYVTATTDYLPLLAEFEVFGSRTSANTNEQNSQAQYEYYKNGNSKVRYRHNNTGSAAAWGLRSSYASNTVSFVRIIEAGTNSYAASNYVQGISPVFCV